MHVYCRPWFCVLTLSAALAAAPAQAAELDKFLPDDTGVVGTLNIRQLLDSGLAKKLNIAKEYEKNVKDNEEASKILKQLGLDPLKDINRITFAAPGKADDKQVFICIHGNFDLTKIHDAADGVIKSKPDHLSVTKEGTLRLYDVKGDDGKTFFACFLNKDVAVVSPTKAYVVDAIAKSTGKREAKFSKDLQALVAKQDPKQSFWIAALATDEMRKQLAGSPQTKMLSEKLESLSAGIAVANDVKFNVLVQTSDPAAAKDLRQKLEGAKALGVLAVSGAEELKDYAPILTDVLNSFKFNQEKGLVTVELVISSEVLDKAVGMIKK